MHAPEQKLIDTRTGEELRVSVTPLGVYSTFTVVTPDRSSVSSDGRYVAFGQLADDLVDDDLNGEGDVFVRDMLNKETVRVSVASSGVEANGLSHSPSISADGNLVAFLSDADNLDPKDGNGSQDVFVHDRVSGTTFRVTEQLRRARSGDQMTFRGLGIAGDGGSAVYSSLESELVDHDTDDQRDVFLFHRETGKTLRVSEPTGGGSANGSSIQAQSSPSSHDGTCVAFASAATNLVPEDGISGLFVKDLTDGRIRRVSIDPAGEPLNPGGEGFAALFPDGSAVAFLAQHQIWVHDLVKAKTTRLGSLDVSSLPLLPQVQCVAVRLHSRAPSFEEQHDGHAVAAAYVSRDNGRALGVYSVSGDVARRVAEEQEWWIERVGVRDSRRITFGITAGRSGRVLCEYDVRAHKVRELFRDLDFIAYDWSPNGRELAYIGLTAHRRRRAAVFLVTPGRDPEQIADLGIWNENGGWDESKENSIAWSPDGRVLLVASADSGAEPAVRIMDRSGRPVAKKRPGALPRWMPSGRVLLRDNFAPPGRWYVLDIDTDSIRGLAMTPATGRPSVSPDGRFVAHNDLADEPTIYLFDMETGEERVLLTGYVAPLWLKPGVLSVMKTHACDPLEVEDCPQPAWEPTGTTRFSIEIETGRIEPTRFPWSRDLDLLISTG
ncbi:MAG: hypothetical protein ACRDKS_15780 [Actinomycetota bacterium]